MTQGAAARIKETLGHSRGIERLRPVRVRVTDTLAHLGVTVAHFCLFSLLSRQENLHLQLASHSPFAFQHRGHNLQ